jgi:hypothetical protein
MGRSCSEQGVPQHSLPHAQPPQSHGLASVFMLTSFPPVTASRHPQKLLASQVLPEGRQLGDLTLRLLELLAQHFFEARDDLVFVAVRSQRDRLAYLLQGRPQEPHALHELQPSYLLGSVDPISDLRSSSRLQKPAPLVVVDALHRQAREPGDFADGEFSWSRRLLSEKKERTVVQGYMDASSGGSDW